MKGDDCVAFGPLKLRSTRANNTEKESFRLLSGVKRFMFYDAFFVSRC